LRQFYHTAPTRAEFAKDAGTLLAGGVAGYATGTRYGGCFVGELTERYAPANDPETRLRTVAQTATDIRDLIRNDRTQPDSAAVAHVLAATVFLGVGAITGGIALLSMSFTGFLPLGYGLWRAIAMQCLVMGFATLAVIGGTYYVLPRLTGVRLWNEKLAWAGLALIAGTTALGLVVVGAGLGDGGEPFALPWWLDLALLAGLGIPPLVALQTVRHRTEHRTYVTVFYVVTGLAALPLLYLAGNVPAVEPVASVIGDFFFSSAYLVILLLVAIGLVHYAVVKQTERPLAGRQLTQIGYWSLIFGAGWFGIAQLAGGPIPGWLGAVAAVLGLGFPVGMVASGASVFSTLEGSWRRTEEPDPVAMLAVAGLALGSVLAILASLAGFRSTANLVALTSFWEGILLGLTLGAIPLLIGSVLIHAIPRMTGRSLFSAELARRVVKLTLYGTGGLIVFLVGGGLITGYAWAGGAFTGAYAAIGEGWAPASGPARVFLGLAAASGIVAVFGNLALASLITRTLTRGTVTTQEILVTREEP
jgi:cytochrome c oxidase cbb3-type subunit I